MTSRCCAHFSKSILLTTLGSVDMYTSLYMILNSDRSISTNGCVKHRDQRPGTDL